MRVIGNGSYGQYLEELLERCLSKRISHLYTGIILFSLGAIAGRYNFSTMAELFIAVTVCLTIVFLLTDGLFAMMNKEVNRNRSLTCFFLLGGLTDLNLVFFGNRTIYLCLGVAALVMVPVLIVTGFLKLRS